MNSKVAKRLRAQAEFNLYTWYASLLTEDQQKELTLDLALQYTPTVKYWYENHDMYDKHTGQVYISKQAHVSEGTLRWFILQEKRRYVRKSVLPPAA